MSKIYILHENREWTVKLIEQLERLGLPYEEWFLDKGAIDLSTPPPPGIFFSRMSASSHTRNHRYAPELTQAVLEWLEQSGRRVINGRRALQLEISKGAQYAALQAHGIRTPRTILALGKEKILEAARNFQGEPFIVKHNRSGKGLGVKLFRSFKDLEDYVTGPDFEEPADGITLVQEYIQSPDRSIVRCEFVGGTFLYAVRVDASQGFELCPADACQIGDQFCPVGTEAVEKAKFQILQDFSHPILSQYEKLLADNGIEVAGIEFLRNRDGDIFTYDINTNTNYNAQAEQVAGVSGMAAVARFLGEELRKSRAGAAEVRIGEIMD